MLRLIFVFAIILYGSYRSVRKGAFETLLFYLWLAYFRPEQWVWDASLLMPLKLSLLVGAFLVVRAPMSDGRYGSDMRSVLLFSFFGLTLVSTLASNHSEYAWPFWEEFAKAITITYLMSGLTTTPSRLRLVMIVIAFSLGFESAKQGWAGLILKPGSRNENPLPQLGDNNGVAVGMLMLVPFFNALAATALTKKEAWIHRFFAVGVAYRAIATYSRGGFLSAGVMIVMWVLRSKQKVRNGLSSAVIAIVIASVLPQAFWDRMSTIRVVEEVTSVDVAEMDTLDDALSGDDSSSAGRLHFWAVAVEMAAANPILGVGYNSYNQAYDRYDFLGGTYGRRRSVHSSWFGVLGELGYTGMALYLTIILLAVGATVSVARAAKRGQCSKDLHHYAIAIQIALAVFSVGGSFVPFQYNEMLWHTIGLSMVLRNLAAAEAVPATEPHRFQRRPQPGFQPGPAAQPV